MARNVLLFKFWLFMWPNDVVSWAVLLCSNSPLFISISNLMQAEIITWAEPEINKVINVVANERAAAATSAVGKNGASSSWVGCESQSLLNTWLQMLWCLRNLVQFYEEKLNTKEFSYLNWFLQGRQNYLGKYGNISVAAILRNHRVSNSCMCVKMVWYVSYLVWQDVL